MDAPGSPPPPDTAQLQTPLAWTDAQGRIVGCNHAFAQWLGVSVRRVSGQPLAALEAEGHALADALRQPVEAMPVRMQRLALRIPGHEALQFADAWLSPHHEGCLLELHPVAEFPGIDPAIALPSALSASLQGLAHELRNPLAGLKGAAQLLSRRHRDDADARALTVLIETEVQRLDALLDALLLPQAPRAHVPLNIHEVTERVLRLAEHDAGWSVKLVRDYDPSLPDVSGDADRLAQALWNLVRNALQADAATVTLRTRLERGVRIGDAQHALALRLEVVDDGRGVPDDIAEQLFVPLVSGRAEGTGLGLAMAQQVAREHRGALSWRSRPGHTVFALSLPMEMDDGD